VSAAREERRRRLAFLILGGLLLLAAAAALKGGSVRVPWGGLLGLAPLDPAAATILWTARAPRVLLAALVGGGLAVVGACLQALFRNPMADAGLLGVGSGAAFGAVVAVHMGWASQLFLSLPLCAFAGAMGTVLGVYALAHASGRPTLHGLLLTGLAVAALASAGTSILLVATEEFRVRTVLFWLAGGLEGRSWDHFRLGTAFIVPAVALLVALARPLDVLSLGETEAASLSLSVHRTRLLVFGLTSLIAGPATAVAGSVPFVGLMAPHALRPFVGPLSRHLLPASFLGGAVLVVLADLVARTASDHLDLPLGSLTALVGAPYFLLALRLREGRA
jgi:iron complex transport system permease protein